MSNSRFWPLPIAYFIALGLIYVANGLMAVAKAGEIDTPFFFKGWLAPIVVFVIWLVLEFADKFTEDTQTQY